MLGKYLMPWAALAILCWAMAPAAGQQPRQLEPSAQLDVRGVIQGKKKRKPATDVSGMACRGSAQGERICLLINDENSAAQIVRLRDTVLTPGAMVELIGETPPKDALGAAPQSQCRKDGKFADFDGEGAAFAVGYFYIAGSHGCSRNKGEFRLSSFYLARVALDEAGAGARSVELTLRLSDVLRAAQPAGTRFARLLDAKTGGLNIEGIAVAGGTIWAGLRAPVDDGNAYIIGAPVSELFASGQEPWKGTPQVLTLPLGPHRGVRDLAALSDGRLLILSGPAQGQAIGYSLHIADPKKPQDIVALGALKAPGDAKAESVTILSENGGSLEILVMYDGPENGGGQFYRIGSK